MLFYQLQGCQGWHLLPANYTTSQSCVSVFKNLMALEKGVEEFSIELKFKEGELVFTLYCRYGKKQHVLKKGCNNLY